MTERQIAVAGGLGLAPRRQMASYNCGGIVTVIFVIDADAGHAPALAQQAQRGGVTDVGATAREATQDGSGLTTEWSADGVAATAW